MKVIKRVKLILNSQKTNPGVTDLVLEVKLDQEAGGFKDGVLKLGKGTESNQKVRINRISVIVHT
jgi:hypothetical protein